MLFIEDGKNQMKFLDLVHAQPLTNTALYSPHDVEDDDEEGGHDEVV